MKKYGWITEIGMKLDEENSLKSERDLLQASVNRLRESNHRYCSRINGFKKRVEYLKDENYKLSDEVMMVSAILDTERERRSEIESLVRDMYWEMVKSITSESVMSVDRVLRYESRMEELGIEVKR